MVLGLVDDREVERRRVARTLKKKLDLENADCEVIDRAPFADIQEYARWVIAEDLVGLIVDENLRDVASVDGHLATHFGHEVVTEIRKTHKELPIFILAANPEAKGLEEAPGDYDKIISRKLFSKKPGDYTKGIVRVISSYLTRHNEELAELARLAERMTTEKRSEEDETRVQAIQARLAIPYYVIPELKREQAIDDYAETVADMKDLVERISGYLKDRQ